MNTAAALAVLHEFVAGASRIAEDPTRAGLAFRRLKYWLGVLGIAPDDAWLEETAPAFGANFVERLKDALRGAGLDAALSTLDGVTPQEAIERIVVLRDEARRAKDWPESDRLRDALARCGIEVKDSKEGTTWSVATNQPA
jgi:cysteinyl-tRNA synthetase